MNPRQNFYSSVFEQIMNYKKEREFENRNFLFDPLIGLGLFASVLVVGVFSGYLPLLPDVVKSNSKSIVSPILKTEQRAAADIFSPDTSSAAEDPSVVNDAYVVQPIEDGYVSADSPRRSFGSEGYLKIAKTPERVGFVKFKMPTETPYTKVLLRLSPKDSGDNGGTLAVLSDNLWSERLLTFDSKPSSGEVLIGSIGPVSSRVSKVVDVTNYVQKGKTYTFKVFTDGVEGVDYASRESSSDAAPVLLLVK